MFAHDKRIRQQEKELRELLMYTYGPDAYQELLGMCRKIREQREKTIYAQARRRKNAFLGNCSERCFGSAVWWALQSKHVFILKH